MASGLHLIDVIGALQPLVRHVTGRSGDMRFAGVPEPTEAWLRAGACSLGLFQEGDGVRVVIWVGKDPRVLVLTQADELKQLVPWARPALQEQWELTPSTTSQEPPKRWPPTLDDVLRRLRAGARAQVGGGRYHTTYYMSGERLLCHIFDEGAESDEEAAIETLRAAIERTPEAFV
jgi:hypothetical protein